MWGHNPNLKQQLKAMFFSLYFADEQIRMACFLSPHQCVFATYLFLHCIFSPTSLNGFYASTWLPPLEH